MTNRKTQKNESRYRNFATVVYPESAPQNWKEIIAELKLPVAVSPLHDKDKNPTGEPKKPHYHVLLCFEGVKSVEQVRALTQLFGGVGVEVVNTKRGYARYLCHLDNPEKAQYSQEDVLCFGGFDFQDVVGLPTDRLKAIEEMMDFCDENQILSYAYLCRYARSNRRDWFRVLCENGTYVIKEYLKSLEWEMEEAAKNDGK